MGTTMGKNGGHFLDALPSQVNFFPIQMLQDCLNKNSQTFLYLGYSTCGYARPRLCW